MPVNNSVLDTNHYETYETRELGSFEYDGQIWDGKLTYSDGSFLYGRSHAPKHEESKRTMSCGGVLSVAFLIALLVVIIWQFTAPL